MFVGISLFYLASVAVVHVFKGDDVPIEEPKLNVDFEQLINFLQVKCSHHCHREVTDALYPSRIRAYSRDCIGNFLHNRACHKPLCCGDENTGQIKYRK